MNARTRTYVLSTAAASLLSIVGLGAGTAQAQTQISFRIGLTTPQPECTVPVSCNSDYLGTLFIDCKPFRITTRCSMLSQIVDALRCAGYDARACGLSVEVDTCRRTPEISWRGREFGLRVTCGRDLLTLTPVRREICDDDRGRDYDRDFDRGHDRDRDRDFDRGHDQRRTERGRHGRYDFSPGFDDAPTGHADFRDSQRDTRIDRDVRIDKTVRTEKDLRNDKNIRIEKDIKSVDRRVDRSVDKNFKSPGKEARLDNDVKKARPTILEKSAAELGVTIKLQDKHAK